jgi:uncharacterized protein
MIIELANVGVLPRALNLRFTPEEIDLDDDGELASDTLFEGEIVGADGKAQLSGVIRTEIRRNCSRCLESVIDPLEIEVNAAFADASLEDVSPEKEISGEDLDESLVIDGKLDLAEVVREQILLALPEQIYCREDCKGLCPQCGANRNLIDCKCAEGDVDPRWAALKNLR